MSGTVAKHVPSSGSENISIQTGQLIVTCVLPGPLKCLEFVASPSTPLTKYFPLIKVDLYTTYTNSLSPMPSLGLPKAASKRADLDDEIGPDLLPKRVKGLVHSFHCLSFIKPLTK